MPRSKRTKKTPWDELAHTVPLDEPTLEVKLGEPTSGVDEAAKAAANARKSDPRASSAKNLRGRPPVDVDDPTMPAHLKSR